MPLTVMEYAVRKDIFTIKNDPDTPLDSELELKVDKVFIPSIRNIDVEQEKKLLIVFSGSVCTGKSWISSVLAEQLSALILTNDDVKRAIRTFLPSITHSEINPMTWRYIQNLYRRLDILTKNHLVVRDGVIDNYYDRILPIFTDQGYKLFIIGSNLTDSFHTALIKERGDTDVVDADRQLVLVDAHKRHMDKFMSNYELDYEITDDNFGKWQPVVDAIQARLQRY